METELWWITRIARVDVVADPLLGCWYGPVQTASHDREDANATPFGGDRLERAFWAPADPTAIVTVFQPLDDFFVPRSVERLPRIILARAASRLWAGIPPILGDRRWIARRTGPMSAAEREARLGAGWLLRMLHDAAPDELVALSREEDTYRHAVLR